MMTPIELKNKINNVVQSKKGKTDITGFDLNVILNDLIDSLSSLPSLATLSNVLTNGNTTEANDIGMSIGRKITSPQSIIVEPGNGLFEIHKIGAGRAFFDINGLVGFRTLTLQDKDITVAGLDDIKNKQIIETSGAFYQVLITDNTIVLLPGSSIVEMMDINSPPPTNLVGQEFTIKNLSNSVCTIQNQFFQTFDGAANILINHGESYTIMATPSFNWIITSKVI